MNKPQEPKGPGEWIGVGEIITTHGVRGELRIHPLTDDPERWEELTRVFCSTSEGTKELHVESVRYHKQAVVVKFEELSDMTQAEKFRGAWLWLPKSERKPLPADRFYRDQIVGIEVYNEHDVNLGSVQEILQTGANDVFVVKGKGREILLPALKSVVMTVDLDANRMQVRIPPGLMEE